MFFLLSLSVVFASLNSILLHKVKLSSAATVYRLNLVCSLVWFLCLFTLNEFQLHLNRSVLLFAAIYGLTQASFIFFKTLAMNRGPVSVTTLIGNASLLLSIAVCYFAWGEGVSIGDGIGLFLLLFAVFLTTYKRSEGTAATAKRGWIFFSLLYLLLGAGVGIAFKAFSKSEAAAGANDMMIAASLLMSLLFLWPALFAGKKEPRGASAPDLRFLLYACASGLLSCLYNRLNITLSGVLDAILFFPFFNGGVVLLSALCSVLFTKERLRPAQVAGLFLGTAGIAVIGIF